MEAINQNDDGCDVKMNCMIKENCKHDCKKSEMHGKRVLHEKKNVVVFISCPPAHKVNMPLPVSFNGEYNSIVNCTTPLGLDKSVNRKIIGSLVKRNKHDLKFRIRYIKVSQPHKVRTEKSVNGKNNSPLVKRKMSKSNKHDPKSRIRYIRVKQPRKVIPQMQENDKTNKLSQIQLNIKKNFHTDDSWSVPKKVSKLKQMNSITVSTSNYYQCLSDLADPIDSEYTAVSNILHYIRTQEGSYTGNSKVCSSLGGTSASTVDDPLGDTTALHVAIADEQIGKNQSAQLGRNQYHDSNAHSPHVTVGNSDDGQTKATTVLQLQLTDDLNLDADDVSNTNTTWTRNATTVVPPVNEQYHHKRPRIKKCQTDKTGCNVANTTSVKSNTIGRNARHNNGLRCGSVNARSINTKPDLLYEYMRSCGLDLYMICESWSNPNRPDHQKIISHIKGSTYNCKHAPREGRAGGGIILFYKKNLKVQKMKPPKTHTFEILEILVQNNKKKIRLVTIYRPEPDPIKNPYTMTECYEEFTELFAYYKSLNEEAIFCGDYNFHMNQPDDDKAKKFKDILETFELKQHVCDSTHKEGNTLDLLISNIDSSVISHQVDLMISDHCNILFNLDMSRPPRIKKNITFRKTKSINIDDFKDDLRNSMAQINLNENLENLVDTYQVNLLEVLDKHAPKQTKLVTIREKTPWTTEEVRPHKRELRRLERKMKRTKLEIDKQLFKDKKAEYKDFLNNKRNEQYTKLIQENSDDPKNLFNVINRALHKKEDTPLPSGLSDEELANDFDKFFDGKIQIIRDNLDSTQNNITEMPETPKYTQQLTEFRSLSQEEVKKLITASASKHCELDPIPTWLLKECIDDLLPLITQIINLSLQLGDMPLSLKKAIINPLLKKLGLELIKKNYRPVSNLAFLSKLIEKAVASQLIEHLKLNKLYDKFQ